MNNRTQLVINENALRQNIQRVKEFAPNLPIIAMVKANAYGHGMEKVSQILNAAVDIFGVACLKEAETLRAIFPQKPILLMAGVFIKEDWERVFEGNFEVVFHEFWQVESFLSLKNKKKLNGWIKIDTGMHRLGFASEDVALVYKQLSACEGVNLPIGLMTHFACADEIENPMTSQQIELFGKIIDPLLNNISVKKLSLANSAGIMAWPAAHQGLVRPGIMLYGISPFSNKIGKDLGLKPVMSLYSRIIAIKECKKGESVGYGSTWRASKNSRMGILSIGYGDGYPRHISDGMVWVKGHYLPLIGRVSMDMLAIDLSAYPEAKMGEVVELWGENLPVEHVARFANTSPYELVTQIRPR